MPLTTAELQNRYTYHPPTEGQPEAYEALRNHALLLAMHINDVCPDSREKSHAFTQLEDVVMWANAAIARHGLPEPLEPVDEPPD
jgi:hypothetical protein